MVADFSYLGQVYLKMGQLSEAAQISGEAVTLLNEHKNVEEVQQIYLNHYHVLTALNDPAAGEYLQKANDAMLTQAMAINDPAKRKIFLEKVRVNRAITAEVVDSDWPIKSGDSVEVNASQAAS
jgi:hypothetical protein